MNLPVYLPRGSFSLLPTNPAAPFPVHASAGKSHRPWRRCRLLRVRPRSAHRYFAVEIRLLFHAQSGVPFVWRCPSRQQTVKQNYIGVGIRDGGVNVFTVWGPGNTAHDKYGTLAEIGDLSHWATVDRHHPEVSCAAIHKGCC